MSKVSCIQNFIIIACRKITFRHNKRVKILRKISFSFIPFIYTGLIFVLTSCANGGNRKLEETPTRGDIKLVVDESFQPLFETEIYTFTHIYNLAKITPFYKPEVDVINDFMNDSVKVIATTRKLTEDQIRYLRDTLIITRTTTFAYDALALVTNKNNNDTLIKYETVKDIFLGKIKTWKEIDQKSRLGDISVIFDNTKSGNIRYFRERFEISDKLPSNFFAVKSNKEVIDFVSKNKNAMGIISVNWISDKDDSTSRSFTRKINVLAISQPFLNDGYYYRPYQGYIYDRSYPFVREIYLISREIFRGLGSGFIQWACAEQGQRIVLKSGLVPATMPIRLVQIKQN
ncbi:MAG: phosphate ABC transporter substrate-binding protein, PhoT family [Odoribacter sp.]|nr:phosphate ABC transporter substrate-binding protein, PhoT family [Odoribacter sp.]